MIDHVRELEGFALERLPSLQLADGVFCEEVVAGEPRPRGRSLRYTLVVLIGLLRAEEHGLDHGFHLGALRSKVLDEIGSKELSPGDLGLALWAESRADGRAAAELVSALKRKLPRSERLDAVASIGVAWILMGLVEAGVRGELGEGGAVLESARGQLLDKRRARSGLVTHVARGPRRRLAHFDDQIHTLLALSQLARVMDDGDAAEAARTLGDRLLELQMPNGAWPWSCDPVRGVVVDPYDVYSVHQDSLAMIGMHGLSQTTGDPRYRAAAVRGMAWSFGGNELGVQMLDPDARMIYRSIRRRSQRARRARTAAATYLRSGPRPASPDELEVDRSMRSFHLGWILEAWAGREELAAEAAEA
ncbi:MAG: hypothetical protein AABM29_05765 [Actinomycetota bacterium]